MTPFPPPSSEDVCFFSPSLPDFLGGVHCPLCPQALSLYLSLSYSLSSSFTEYKEQKSVREKSFTWTRRATGTTWPQKEDNETEKGDVSVYLYSHVLCPFPLAAVQGENDRRMSGSRARLFSLKSCHGKHIHALWDLFIPWCTTIAHTCTYICALNVRSLSSHTCTPCHEMEGWRGVKGQALQ